MQETESEYSQTGYADEDLPDEWIQSYYSITETANDIQITAVYEDLDTEVVAIVYPDTNAEYSVPMHKQICVYPVYTDIGIPYMFTDAADEIRPYTSSIAPHVNPTRRNPDSPNLNQGPYLYKESGKVVSFFTGYRTAEGECDYHDYLPDEAIQQMQTYRNYPLDYRRVIDSLQNIREIASVYREEPSLIENPYPIQISVQYAENTEQHYLATSPLTDSAFIQDTVFPQTTIPRYISDEYPAGTKIATVYLDLNSDGYPTPKKIVSVKSHIDTQITHIPRTNNSSLVGRIKSLLSM